MSYGLSHPFKISIGGSGSARVILNGCDKPYDKVHLIDPSGDIDVALSQAVNSASKKTCVLDGAVITDDFEDVLITVLVSIYDDKYTPLGKPFVEFKENGSNVTLNVASDKVVSVTSLDGQYDLSYKTEFDKFNKDVFHLLRFLTVKGRSGIYFWTPGEQLWTWAN